MTPTGSSEQLVAHLLGLPVAERAQCLALACIENPDLYARQQEIEAALASVDSRPVDFPTARSAEASLRALDCALEATEHEVADSRIGAYRLLQQIGEGGFGVVWMAEQLEPIKRRVALKIVKIGMDTREVVARFEAERQALALMDHPNIARVLDAGATDAGRPFFVMELVRGVPITRYCDENRLAAEERLRLFISICHAVQHAHQKGIIHRDLKPSNILITLHDGVPVPKVIDFGIAKATGGTRLTEKTLFTQFQAFMGTPAYTSPEQMEMSGFDVDTRSDVYSLGVLLYELLTGRPPFDPGALVRSGLEAMRRTIREVDPPRPSQRLEQMPVADRTTIAQQRRTDVAKLSILLRGDVDWIVMHCLEKDRTRRYETAAGLALDVQRHLASEPVSARPPARLYRFRKFVRRHRLGFTAATVMTISVIAGLIISSVLLVRERAARARAVTAERSEAELRQHAETARQDEVRRAARTALDVANRNLADGRVSEGLAYLVYAARKDPFNPTLASRLASTLTSHNFVLPEAAPFDCQSPVIATQFSIDGRTFLVGTVDGTLRRFDAVSGRRVSEFQLGQAVKPFGGWQFARSSDAVFAVRFEDNSLQVFDAATGRPLHAPITLDPKVSTDPAVPQTVGLSPDGHWLYARSPTEIWLWDVVSGEERFHRAMPFDGVDSDISENGRRLAVTSGNEVQLWSLPEAMPVGKPFRIQPTVLRAQPGAFTRFSPDSLRLAVLAQGTAIHTLDASTGDLVGSSLPLEGFVYPTMWDFSPDGRLLVISSRSTRLTDLVGGRAVTFPMVARGYFERHALSRDGKALLTSHDGFVQLWDTTTGKLLFEPVLQQPSMLSASVSPEGDRLIVGTTGGLLYRLRVARNVAQPLILPRRYPGLPAPFLPDRPASLLWFAPEHAEIIDVTDGRREPGFNYPKPITINPPGMGSSQSPLRIDGKFLIVRDRSNQWEAWELGADGVRHVVPLHDAPTDGRSVSFNPVDDQVAIVTGSTIQRWDLHSGARVGSEIESSRPIESNSVNFSPDGRRLAFGSTGGLASIWDLQTSRQITRLEPLPDSTIRAVRFNPDGTKVVTIDRTGGARLWNATTGAPISPVLNHSDAGLNAKFSPDGRRVATWTYVELCMWEGENGAPTIAPIRSMTPRHICFDADSARFLVAGDDGNVRVWDTNSGLPLTDTMSHQNFEIPLGDFSPDGRFIRTETTEFKYYIWSIPPRRLASARVPEWLLELATLCSTKRVNESGDLIEANDTVANFEMLRARIEGLPPDAPLADWGRWVLDDRINRPIAPGFSITPAVAKKLAAEFAKAAEASRP